jgi:hypothetical protein
VIERWRNVYERVPEPSEPTAEQCSATASVPVPPGGRACWYPSVGGYAGKAVAGVDEDGGVNVWVWHDGQFPFRSLDDQDEEPPRSPVLLHHCIPVDFIQFGQSLEGLAGAPALLTES